ncbi:MAG: Hsp70 family protein, partial [Myxococcales bacterium]
MSNRGDVKPKYAVGIDLGTTNCAVSFLSLDSPEPVTAVPPSVFAIPQLVQPGQVEPKPLLPSFLYLPHEAEFPKGALKLPWDEGRDFVVGELARNHGALVPVRLVS